MKPLLGESILDPACGTGGFLTCVIEHLRKQAKTEEHEATIQDSFSGIEKKGLPHVLCMTNLLLHGIDVPSNVRHDNTLARPLRDWGPKERVDCIVTNPPFGGMEEDGIESNYPAEFRTRETADLFLVLIMKILKPGGRAGLVLPDGTLFGEGVKTRIKEALLTECNLHTIVRLPNGVFNPYTGIRTNLLFFTKGTPTKEIWYYEHPYPAGAKSYNKGKPISIAEFDAEKKWWGKPDKHGHYSKREESEQAWRVSIEDIKANGFNLDIKNPHNSDTGPGNLDHLLPEYETLLEKIASTRVALRQELHHGLQSRPVAIETLFEKSELFADAPNAAARMRELVLELAMQGKLIEPKPAEGDGHSLLKKLRTLPPERNSKSRSPKDITVEPDTLLKIPDHWALTTVENTTRDTGFFCDGDWVESKDQDPSGDVRLIQLADVGDGQYRDRSSRFMTKAAAKRLNCSYLASGDILVARMPDPLGRCCRFPGDPKPSVTVVDVCILRPNIKFFDSDFLVIAINCPQFRRLVAAQATGTTRSRISRSNLGVLPIPLPPLAEQKRIVAKVDELMALVDELEAQLAASRATAKNLLDALVAELTAT